MQLCYGRVSCCVRPCSIPIAATLLPCLLRKQLFTAPCDEVDLPSIMGLWRLTRRRGSGLSAPWKTSTPAPADQRPERWRVGTEIKSLLKPARSPLKPQRRAAAPRGAGRRVTRTLGAAPERREVYQRLSHECAGESVVGLSDFHWQVWRELAARSFETPKRQRWRRQPTYRRAEALAYSKT
jgi:hypothetical protein